MDPADGELPFLGCECSLLLVQGKDPIEQMTEQVMKAMQRHAQGQDPPPEMATKETLTDIIRTATMEFLNQASNSTLGEPLSNVTA